MTMRGTRHTSDRPVPGFRNGRILARSSFRLTLMGVLFLWGAASFVPGLPSGTLQAQTMDQFSRGISVTGTGDVLAKPNVAELDVRSQASAELTNDAIVKYKETRRRMSEAFTKLKIPELSLVEQGLNIGSSAGGENNNPWGGRQMQPLKQSVIVSRGFKLRIKGIDKMTDEKVLETIGKVFDTAKDSGTPIGPTQDEINNAWRYGRAPRTGMTRFFLEDFSELRESAYQKAIEDARKRADRLAKLHNLKIGPVTSIRESFVAGDDSTVNRQQYYYGYESAPEPDETGPRIEASSFTNIRLRVKVSVQFSILDKDGKPTPQ